MKNLVEYIDRILIGTKEGKISWTRLSENAFVWKTTNSSEKKINLVLQSSKTLDNKVKDVLFRLFDFDEKSVILDIRTEKTSSENAEKIFELFNFVKQNSGLEKLEMLDDILKDI